MLARHFPVKTLRNDAHIAKNRPFLARVSTGCAWYAAIRAQEVYEGIQATKWFLAGLVPATALSAAAGALIGGVGAAMGFGFLGACAFGLFAGRCPYPGVDNRTRRELLGQAIENVVLRVIYNESEETIEANRFWNAVQISTPHSSYARKGYFPNLHAIPWEPLTLRQFQAGHKVPERIQMAMVMLENAEEEAHEWVMDNLRTIASWRAEPGVDREPKPY